MARLARESLARLGSLASLASRVGQQGRGRQKTTNQKPEKTPADAHAELSKNVKLKVT